VRWTRKGRPVWHSGFCEESEMSKQGGLSDDRV
jgi:hypothetical protein